MRIEIGEKYSVRHVDTESDRAIYSAKVLDLLRERLIKEGVDSHKFSVNGMGDDGCLFLQRVGEFWGVSRLENGQKVNPALFFEIHDAVDFLVWKLLGRRLALLS